jgi:hypothetical protein
MRSAFLFYSLCTRSVSTDEPVAAGFFILANPKSGIQSRSIHPRTPLFAHLINIVTMNPLIRIFFILLFLSLSVIHAFAGNGSAMPFYHFSGNQKQIRNSSDIIRTVDSFLSVSLTVSKISSPAGMNAPGATASHETTSSRGRICSCQILNLSSSNFDHRHMALLAEKTDHGTASDFSAAKNSIEKEKKQLKKMFYDKVKLVSESAATGSCKALYVRLKSGDSNLELYEILNADIR